MRTKLRSKISLLFLTCAVLLALPAAAWAAATLDTSADLATSAATPTNVQIGANNFNIKVWATNGNIPNNDSGIATVGNAYSMATDGTITRTGTTTVDFSNMNYSQCPATGGTQGCPGNPFVVPATLTVASGTPDGRTGVLTVYHLPAANSGLTADTTPASGNVKVVNPQPQKQNQTISFGALAAKTYGDAAFNVSATASSNLPVSFAASGNCTVSGTTVNITGAGNCDITASQAGDASYNAAPNVTQSFLIAKKTATVNLSNLTQTYNGSPREATVTTNPPGLNVSVTYDGSPTAPTTAGSYAVVATVNDGNYQGSASDTITIEQASQTINFGALGNKTFGDANFQVSATGGGSGEPVTFAAEGNCTVSGNTVTITGAGSCTITASQGGNANYAPAQDVSQTFSIEKATATLSLVEDDLSQVYDGNAKTVGVNTTPDVPDKQITVTYDGNTQAPTNAGSYHMVASMGEHANYQADPVEGTLVIAKAPATLTLGNLTGHTYDGQPKAASVTTNPANLSGVSITYDGSATAPTNAGSYAVVASLDNPNYQATNATGTLMIGKATPQVAITWSDSTYDGNANAASATVNGVGTPAADLGPADSLTYYAGSDTTGTALSGAPKDAGTYTVKAEFNGNSNYEAASNQKTITIAKAASTTTVTCTAGPFTYDGSAKTPCSAKVTGDGGLNLTPDVVYNNNTNAGEATASYTYEESANYKGSSDSKNFTIDKASSTTAVSCTAGPFTYTGSAHTPCSVSVTGAGGLNLSPNPDYADNVGAGQATASYTFAGDANHNGSNDSKNFTIDKASSTTAVTCPTSVTYTGSALTPCSANVTGAGGLNQPVPVNYSNNTDAGTATASASYAGDANHNNSSDSKTFTISFNFTGFASPVDNNNVLNSAKAGQAIPLKWRLTDASGNPVTNLLSTDVKVSVASLNCSLGTTPDQIEEYAAGSSGLQNLGNGYYQFNWKTPTNYANSCKTLTLDLGEGTLTTPHTALFKFTK